MLKSMFAAVAGLEAHQQRMDVIGNNIANVNTWGFKASSVSFKDAIYQTIASAQGGRAEENMYGGRNPSQVGYGTSVGTISTSFRTGGMATSDDPLHCMIDGTAFFMVGPFKDGVTPSAEGTLDNAGLSLSRVGLFTVDDNGYLVDNDGNYVYGYANTETDDLENPNIDTTTLVPIRIPYDGDNPKYSLSGYSIKSDGTVVGTTTDSKTLTIGKIALAAVQNPSGLQKGAGYYYNVGANSGVVKVVDAGGAAGQILGNTLEMSNVNLANEFSQMIMTQRGFQANSKIITVSDQMLEELVNMKR